MLHLNCNLVAQIFSILMILPFARPVDNIMFAGINIL